MFFCAGGFLVLGHARQLLGRAVSNDAIYGDSAVEEETHRLVEHEPSPYDALAVTPDCMLRDLWVPLDMDHGAFDTGPWSHEMACTFKRVALTLGVARFACRLCVPARIPPAGSYPTLCAHAGARGPFVPTSLVIETSLGQPLLCAMCKLSLQI